jgi:DNA-binding GntR family transcriptional regulator
VRIGVHIVKQNFRECQRLSNLAGFLDVPAMVGSMTTAASPTRAEELYQRLRSDILSTRYQPGERLKFPQLCSEYGTSVGVAREVLTRLAAERFVVPIARQGFSVVTLSADELIDLTVARTQIEGLVLEQAIKHADAAWEAQVLAAHHLLSRTPMPDAHEDPEGMADWATVHEAFHSALLAGCPSRRLRETAQSLREEAELYRRWSSAISGTFERDVAAEHQAIADAAIARDGALAVGLLRDHIAFTTRILLRSTHDEQVSSLMPLMSESAEIA